MAARVHGKSKRDHQRQKTLKAKDRKKGTKKVKLDSRQWVTWLGAPPPTANLLLQGHPLGAVAVCEVCSTCSTRDGATGHFANKASFPSTRRKEEQNTATVNGSFKFILCLFRARSVRGQHKNLLHWQGLTTKFWPKTSQFTFARKTRALVTSPSLTRGSKSQQRLQFLTNHHGQTSLRVPIICQHICKHVPQSPLEVQLVAVMTTSRSYWCRAGAERGDDFKQLPVQLYIAAKERGE